MMSVMLQFLRPVVVAFVGFLCAALVFTWVWNPSREQGLLPLIPEQKQAPEEPINQATTSTDMLPTEAVETPLATSTDALE